MKHKEKLEVCLVQHLPWHKSRVEFVACFLLSLIQQKTVNLVSISQGFASQAKAESSYRRIQRFFEGYEVKPELFSTMIIRLLPEPPYTGCLDRTSHWHSSGRIRWVSGYTPLSSNPLPLKSTVTWPSLSFAMVLIICARYFAIPWLTVQTFSLVSIFCRVLRDSI